MKLQIAKQTIELNQEHMKKRRRYKIFGILAAIVIFCTAYALVMPAITMTAQSEAVHVSLEDGGANTAVLGGTLAVTVEIPTGAMADAAEMTVRQEDVEELADPAAILNAANAAEGQLVEAVDITFLDRDGDEVEPAAGETIQVSIASAELDQDQDLRVVHLAKQADGSVIPELVENAALSPWEAPAEDTEESGDAETDGSPAPDEDAEEDQDDAQEPELAISFEADAFSVYVIVAVTEERTAEETTLTGELDGVTVTLEAPDIPEDASLELAVRTESEDGDAYTTTVDVTARDAQGREIDLDGVQAEITVSVSEDAVPDQAVRMDVQTAADGAPAATVQSEAVEDGGGVTAAFTTEGLPAIILQFTVDFHYGDLTFCIEGYSDILLSQLFEAIGYDEHTAAEAAEVTFTDSDLLALSQTEEDWLLTSLAAFDTEEYLTVGFDDDTELVILVTDAQGTSNTVTYYQESSIMKDVKTTGKNDWQITAQKYAGNTAAYKTTSDDGYVRVQKNVIPTDTENEFQVYLSVDVSEMSVLYEQLTGIGIIYTPSNNAPNYGDPWGNNNANKANTAWSTAKDQGNNRVYYPTKTKDLSYEWTLAITIHKGTDAEQTYNIIRYASSGSFNNGHIVFKVGNQWMTVGDAAKVNGKAQFNVTLDDTALEKILSYYGGSVDLGTILDTMGESSIVLESQQPSVSSGSTEVTTLNGQKIDWDIGSVNLSGATRDGYYTNVAELLYTVTLDVTEEGFVSGKSYAVNKNAALTYQDQNGVTRSVEFPVPYVRGATYGFSFTKVTPELDGGGNETGSYKKLAGATFQLAGTNGQTADVSRTVTTDDTGAVSFTGLPWGQYTLTETPPRGYTAEKTSWTLYIGYTGDGSANYGKHLDGNYPATYTDSSLAPGGQIVNYVSPQRDVTVYKVDEQGNPLSGAAFTLGKAGEPAYETLPGDGGDAASTFQFEGLDVGALYCLTETVAPEGYNRLLSSIYFQVQSDGLEFTDEKGTKLTTLPAYLTAQADDFTLTVINEPGYELPSTGGPGTGIYTLSGALLLSAALLYGFGLRRKQERRSE